MPTPRVSEGVDLVAAVAHLAADGSVAFPTETVWGLGARAVSDAAVAALRAWKGRSDQQPISVLVADPGRLRVYGFRPSARAEALMAAFWPGPLTLILPCSGRFAAGIARADGAVGVRCSAHPIAAGLACAAEDAGLGPITATSLNRSGEPPVQSEAEARLLCPASDQPAAPLVVAAGAHDAGAAPPSTVLDLSGSSPALLRIGAIGAAALAPHGIAAQAGDARDSS